MLVVLGLLAVMAAARATIDDGAVRMLVALAGAVVLAVVLAGMMAGFRTDGSSSPAEPSATREVGGAGGAVPLRPATIQLVAVTDDQLPPVPAVVGGLADGTLVVLGVSGLDPGSRGSVHQCPTGALAPSGCRAGLPVSVDVHGRVVILVDLEDRLPVASGEPVDCTSATGCSIVVFGSSRLEVVTVFGRPAPPPVTVEAEPARVPPGGTTLVTARGLPPGAPTSFVVCRPSGRGEADCGTRTPVAAADGNGQVSGPVMVPAGRCPRGARCAIAVVVGDGGPRAFSPLHLIGRSGASYDEGRLQIGLVVATILGLVGLWLLRRTDWTPVDGDPFAGVVIPDDPFADDEVGASTH